MATRVEESIEVAVPIGTAYNQWTQFEDFPHFMGGIDEVRQLDDKTLHWVAQIGGVKREWNATILEQVPDEKVAWAATEGATNAGAVRFAPAGADRTIVTLALEYEPEGLVEQAGDKLGIVGRRVKADLDKFKSFIEDAGYASGAWRGTVPGSAGTPGVEAAESSRGDSGSAGVSAKTVIAGAAGVAAAAAGGLAAAKKLSGDETEVAPTTETETVVVETDTLAAPPATGGVGVGDAVPRDATYPADPDPDAPLPTDTEPGRGI